MVVSLQNLLSYLKKKDSRATSPDPEAGSAQSNALKPGERACLVSQRRLFPSDGPDFACSHVKLCAVFAAAGVFPLGSGTFQPLGTGHRDFAVSFHQSGVPDSWNGIWSRAFVRDSRKTPVGILLRQLSGRCSMSLFNKVTKTFQWGKHTVTMETGEVARQLPAPCC